MSETMTPLPPPLYLDPDTYIGRYTGTQMREYAREYGAACAAAERARVLAWLDDALADTKVCWPGEIDIVREQIASGRARGEALHKNEDYVTQNKCIADQHTEIASLRAESNECGSGAGCLHREATIAVQDEEIERLRAAAQQARAALTDCNWTNGPLSEALRALDAALGEKT